MRPEECNDEIAALLKLTDQKGASRCAGKRRVQALTPAGFLGAVASEGKGTQCLLGKVCLRNPRRSEQSPPGRLGRGAGSSVVCQLREKLWDQAPFWAMLCVQTNWLNLKVPRLRWKVRSVCQGGWSWTRHEGAVVFHPLQSPGNTVSSSLLLSPPLPSFSFAHLLSFFLRGNGIRLK